MCSRRVRLGAVLLLLATTTVATGCGRKGDPIPPPRVVAATTTDLAVRERGAEIALEFAYPKSTVAGLASPPVDAVELYEITLAATSDGKAPEVDSRELAKSAKKTIVLGGPELAAAVVGGRVAIRFPLALPLPDPPQAHLYAVKTHVKGGERSAFSNVVGLVPKAPPEPPGAFTVTPQESGIDLGWVAPEGLILGFDIYRRAATDSQYGKRLSDAGPDSTTFTDTTAKFGNRYIYAIAAVSSHEPLVESAFSAEREIDYVDRFPPSPPPVLRALSSPGSVRLLWEPSPASDVAGYIVYRQDVIEGAPPGEFRQVTPKPIPENEFTDTGLVSGATFRYRIAAIDKAGNLGEPSVEEEAHVP